MRSRCASICQVLFDVSMYLVVAACMGLLFTYGKPTHRGFFCDDESIKYPYLPNTVTITMLIAGGMGFPICSFLIIEIILWCNARKKTRCISSLKSTLRLTGVFMFGGAATMLLTEIGKLAVGRLRPHFFDICKPDFSSLNCGDGYITHYQCTNQNVTEYELTDARKSFPSGHASYAAYIAIYICYYYHQRIQLNVTVLLKMVIQLFIMCASIYCALSRVMDNRHHWSDVLAGYILGVLVAVWIIHTLNRMIIPKKELRTRQYSVNMEDEPAMLRKRTISKDSLGNHV